MQGKELERRRLFTQACRDFFTSDVEKTVVRPVAATFGHIPENENVLKMSEDELSTLYKGNPDSWLQPAFEQVGSSKRVRGNYQVEFPSDGPKSKYAALFDSNPCFDPLRVAFVEEHTPQGMKKALRQVLGDLGGQPWERDLTKFIYAIEQFETTALQVGEAPVGFADIIWTSYLKVLANPNYFLSTDELVVVATVLQTNLIIVMRRDSGSFFIRGRHICSNGPCVFALLKGDPDKGGTLRSHYERLFR